MKKSLLSVIWKANSLGDISGRSDAIFAKTGSVNHPSPIFETKRTDFD